MTRKNYGVCYMALAFILATALHATASYELPGLSSAPAVKTHAVAPSKVAHGAPAQTLYVSQGGGGGNAEIITAEDRAAVASIEQSLNKRDLKKHEKKFEDHGSGNLYLYLFVITVLVVLAGVIYVNGRVQDSRGNTSFKWTLSSKLTGGFAIVITLLVGLSIFTLTSLSSIGVEVKNIAEDIIPITGMITTIETLQLNQAIVLERAIRFGGEDGARAKEKFEEAKNKFQELTNKTDKKFEEAITFIEKLPARNKEDAKEQTDVMNNLEKMVAEHKDFEYLVGKVFELFSEGKHAQVGLLEVHIETSEDKLDRATEQFLGTFSEHAQKASMTAKLHEKTAANILLIASVLISIVALAFAQIFARSISRPVIKTVEMVQELAKGNLDVHLEMRRNDEIGTMVKAVDRFAEDLSSVMTEVNASADQVTGGSSQVSDSSQSLSQGATESAASLEEITSSLTEVASQTKTNAENATQANQLATEARNAAENGNRQMKEMVTAVAEINESSKSISKIIKAIDEIAFQTNLLALNAAVEAARAGKHGKGFAVVAEEVRNLAARSAKAAEETSELIEGSVKKAEKGASIAEKTSEALNEIVTGVTKVTDLVSEIASASNEQAQGITQVNQALGQVDQVTQQNTANAEEGAAAAEELAGQASHLKQMLTRFKLRNGNGRSRKVAQLPPARGEAAGHIGGNGEHVHYHVASMEGGNGAIADEQTKAFKPSDVIALDDKEFGKY